MFFQELKLLLDQDGEMNMSKQHTQIQIQIILDLEFRLQADMLF